MNYSLSRLDHCAHLFSDDDVSILRKFGQLFEDLANGNVAPKTLHEEEFVQCMRQPGPVGRGKSEKVWLRYKTILAVLDRAERLSKDAAYFRAEHAALLNENSRINQELDQIKSDSAVMLETRRRINADLKAEIQALKARIATLRGPELLESDCASYGSWELTLEGVLGLLRAGDFSRAPAALDQLRSQIAGLRMAVSRQVEYRNGGGESALGLYECRACGRTPCICGG